MRRTGFCCRRREAGTLEFVCVFSNAPVSVAIPTVTQALMDTTNHWTNFWSTGGAIDLSASTDSRWFELERRIVLSEYEDGGAGRGQLGGVGKRIDGD